MPLHVQQARTVLSAHRRELVHPPIERSEPLIARSARRGRQARFDGLAIDGHLAPVDHDLVVALAHVDVVLHAAGRSSQTVSTCVVWGNMSNDRTDTIS